MCNAAVPHGMAFRLPVIMQHARAAIVNSMLHTRGVCVFCAGHWAARGGHSSLPARPVSPGTLELLTSPSPDCQSLSDLLMSSEEEDLLL